MATPNHSEYFAPIIMSDFLIEYKIGKGTKVKSYTVKDADDKMDASVRFQNEGPDNSFVVHIEEIGNDRPVRRKDQIYRRMIIHNSFDQFILDTLQEKNLTNQALIGHMHMTRKTWSRLREHPENFYLYDLILMSDFLAVPLSTLIAETTKVIEDNKTKKSLWPVRFRNS